MSNNIALNFINQSTDQNNSQVVIFEGSEATNPTALSQEKRFHKSISNCGPGNSHAFSIPATVSVIHLTAVHSEATDTQTKIVANRPGSGQLSLDGISSADIIMTGGGTGPQATPFTFSLENVKRG